jgi:nitroimidazol reductase NimA-like FMN-containing flavoprotein (pyridoxamine 5'-phosphate oxidase superfamily)
MGIQLNDEEAWDFIARSHTGVLTTLRRDGVPISLPLWFASFDRGVYFVTPIRSKKVGRVRHDSRACFLVESGEAWRELSAVVMTGTVALVEAEDVQARVRQEMDRKYAAFRPNLEKAPEATRKHYGGGSATLCFTPGKAISWDNSRIRFRAE